MSVGGHLPGTEGAATVATVEYRTCAAMVAQAARWAGIFVVTSDVAGVGKSLATLDAATATGLEVHQVQFSPDAAATTVNAVILDSLGVRVGRGDYVAETTAELRRLLDQRNRLVLVESAHDLTSDTLAHLRILHNQAEFTLGFVGHRRFLARAAAQPELFDDADRRIQFHPLPAAEVATVMADCHPLLAGCPRPQLEALDGEFCHGRWKRWAQFLRTAVLYAHDDPDGILSPTVVDYSLRALNWRPSRDARRSTP